MRITFDAKRAFNNVTGLGNYSRSIIRSIANEDSSLNLYLFTPTNNRKLFSIKNKNTYIIHPSYWTNKTYWRNFGINNEFKKQNIDIYHGLSGELPFNKKVKSIVTIHDLLFLKYPQFYKPIDRLIYTIKTKQSCKTAKKIIAISHQTKLDIIKFFNIPENKIEVIYQSCSMNFINNNHPQNLIDKFKLKKPYLLYVGTIEERKNLIFLLKAIKENKEWNLICIGKKKNYFKKVSQYIQQNNLKKQVRFIDVLNEKELSLIYQKSRGLVYPSIDEGFGIPILEAMYSKTPVITSNKSIFKEVCGINSYYFEENELTSLKNQIKKIWEDSNERDNRIKINLNYVQKFNEKKQAVKIINLYNIIKDEEL